MKINSKILSIPPYLSTTWDQVASLHLDPHHSHPSLLILLKDGTRVEIPSIDPPLVDLIFAAHALYLEGKTQSRAKTKAGSAGTPQLFSISVPMPQEAIQQLADFMQHNPEHADHPDLPPETLEKIRLFAQSLGMEELMHLGKPESGCNCVYCQVSHALNPSISHQEEQGEPVSDEDLKFRTWEIKKMGDKLFCVSNSKENYSVFLGDPIGCTCGEKNCEHVRAVLES